MHTPKRLCRILTALILATMKTRLFHCILTVVILVAFLLPLSLIPSIVAVPVARGGDEFAGPWKPSAIAVDNQGVSHMVVQAHVDDQAEIYYVQTKGQIVLAVENLSKNRSWSWNPDISIHENKIHVVWQDDQSGYDQVYHRDKKDGIWGALTQVSSSTSGAQSPRFLITENNVLQIDWKEYTPSERRTVRCTWGEDTCISITNIASELLRPASETLQAEQETRKLAFVGNDGNIWTVGENGTNLSQLTTSSSVSAFAWSPTGHHIAYVSRGGDIYLMNADGSDQHAITSDARARGFDIDWVGSRVVFIRDYDKVSYVDVTDPSHTVVDIKTEIPFYGYGIHWPSLWPTLRWSSDGQWVTFEVYPVYGLAVMASDGMGYLQYDGWEPNWKQDSSRVIYVSSSGISLLNPSNGDSSQLSSVAADFAAYSPNDVHVAYTSPYLWRMNADNSGHILLSSDRVADPVWAPQGDKIAYARWYPIEGFYEYNGIYVINADGTGRRWLAWGHHPEWQPAGTGLVTGKVTDGHGHSLSGVLVGLLKDAESSYAMTTTTDAEGDYTFVNVPPAAEYRVKVVLRDGSNTTQIHWSTNRLLVSAQTQPFSFPAGQTSVTQDIDFGDASLDSTPIPVDRMDDLAVIFYHSQQVNDFVRNTLGESSFQPVESVWGFSPLGDRPYYCPPVSDPTLCPQERTVNIPTRYSQWDDPHSPMNREWHENFHHIMQDTISIPPYHACQSGSCETRDCTNGDCNHWGYVNHCTVDSWVEGWAEFWPCVLWDNLGYPGPHYYRANYQVDNGWVSLEYNWQVWDESNSQSREEFAVASLLWDLYDPKDSSDSDNVDLGLDTLWSVIGQTTPDNDLSDMRDVYNALWQATLVNEDGAPVTGADIDDVFITHGFYADLNGNHQWDSGEEAGWGGRDYRRNTPEVLNAYLKVNVEDEDGNPLQNSSLLVEVHFDNSYCDYSYAVDLGDATGNMVYLELPPTRTLASAEFTAIYGGGRSDPYTIENSTYWAEVASSTTGYAEELTFVVRGPRIYLPIILKNYIPGSQPPPPTVETLNFKVSFQARDNAGNKPQNVPIKVKIKNLSGDQVLFETDWVLVTPAGSGDNRGTASVDVSSAALTPSQSYQIFVRGAMHLAKQVTLPLTDGLTIDYTDPALNPDGVLWACDVNQDNQVRDTDVSIVLSHYGPAPSDPDPSSEAYCSDQNGDGVVNSFDLAICNTNLGKVGD